MGLYGTFIVESEDDKNYDRDYMAKTLRLIVTGTCLLQRI